MPYAQCPMPHAQCPRVPHLSEKGYKSFLRTFAPTTPEMIDRIIAVALHLINAVHLKNWFTKCCYCTS